MAVSSYSGWPGAQGQGKQIWLEWTNGRKARGDSGMGETWVN